MVTPPDEEAIVRCDTTKGPFAMKFVRSWAPNGYDRAVELYERKFYDDSHIFRAIPGFLVQFGISYSTDQELQTFARSTFPDDPTQNRSFEKGTVSFAGYGDNSRTCQMFISYGKSTSLGGAFWETPFGEVIEGMDNVEKFYSYGDMPPGGNGPRQGKIYEGPKYIEENFPLIDKFIHCSVERLSKQEKKVEGEVTKDAASGTVDLNYRPHMKDQPGLPSFDIVSAYGGIGILTAIGIAMVMLNRRRKTNTKSN